MLKKLILIGLSIILIIYIGSITGCGKVTQVDTSNGDKITIEGIVTNTVSSSSIKKMSLEGYSVTGKIINDLGNEIVVGSTTVDKVNKYILNVDAEAASEDVLIDIKDSNGIIVAGSVAINVKKGDKTYPRPCNEKNLKMKDIMEKAGKKGLKVDPQDIDDKLYEHLDDLTYEETEAYADVLIASHTTKAQYANSLGISEENMKLMEEKGREFHRLYVEPILKTAYENGAEPDRDVMTAIFETIDKKMMEYAKTLGISNDTFSALKNAYEGDMQYKMKEKLGENNEAFKEFEHRNYVGKFLDSSYQIIMATESLANTALPGKLTFKQDKSTLYSQFQTDKDITLTEVKRIMNDLTADKGQVIDLIVRNIIDKWVAPFGEFEQTNDAEYVFNNYKDKSILLYFFNSTFGGFNGTRNILEPLMNTVMPLMYEMHQRMEAATTEDEKKAILAEYRGPNGKIRTDGLNSIKDYFSGFFNPEEVALNVLMAILPPEAL